MTGPASCCRTPDRAPPVRRLRRAAAGRGLRHRAGRGYAFGRMANGVPLDRYVRRIVVDAVLAADEGRTSTPRCRGTSPGPRRCAGGWPHRRGWPATPGTSRCTWPRCTACTCTSCGRVLRPPGGRPGAVPRTGPRPRPRREPGRAAAGPGGRGGPGRAPGVAGGPGVAAPPAPPDPPVREWAPSDRLRPGFLVAGYLRAELGVGEAARLTVGVPGGGPPAVLDVHRHGHGQPPRRRLRQRGRGHP